MKSIAEQITEDVGLRWCQERVNQSGDPYVYWHGMNGTTPLTGDDIDSIGIDGNTDMKELGLMFINEALERAGQLCYDKGCPDCANDIRALKS